MIWIFTKKYSVIRQLITLIINKFNTNRAFTNIWISKKYDSKKLY